MNIFNHFNMHPNRPQPAFKSKLQITEQAKALILDRNKKLERYSIELLIQDFKNRTGTSGKFKDPGGVAELNVSNEVENGFKVRFNNEEFIEIEEDGIKTCFADFDGKPTSSFIAKALAKGDIKSVWYKAAQLRN